MKNLKSRNVAYDPGKLMWQLVYVDHLPWYGLVQLWEGGEVTETVRFKSEGEYKVWAAEHRAAGVDSFAALDQRTDKAKRDSAAGKRLARELLLAEAELGRAAYRVLLLSGVEIGETVDEDV